MSAEMFIKTFSLHSKGIQELKASQQKEPILTGIMSLGTLTWGGGQHCHCHPQSSIDKTGRSMGLIQQSNLVEALASGVSEECSPILWF